MVVLDTPFIFIPCIQSLTLGLRPRAWDRILTVYPEQPYTSAYMYMDTSQSYIELTQVSVRVEADKTRQQ